MKKMIHDVQEYLKKHEKNILYLGIGLVATSILSAVFNDPEDSKD